MPAMFALGDKVIGNAQVAIFAAFGSFAMLLLVDFGGPMAERLQAQAALAVTGGVFVCIATLVSQTVWLAAVAMAVVGFGVIFAGVVSSVLAGAATALLVAFILPVSLAAPASALPARLAGWGMAAGAALVATALLWPAPARDRLRGAAAATCRALASTVRFGMSRGDPRTPALPALAGDAARAAAASRRLDDAFRTYLAERGAKPVPLAVMAGLVAGVAGLRLEADAVLDLWQGSDGQAGGDLAAARQEILDTAERITGWYDGLAATLIAGGELPQPLAHDKAADGRLVRAVRRDLLDNDDKATAAAVRVIWTGDHLDAVRRLQAVITSPARADEAGKGGHFAAWKQPQLFSEELRAAFRPLRDWAKMAVPVDRGGGHGR